MDSQYFTRTFWTLTIFWKQILKFLAGNHSTMFLVRVCLLFHLTHVRELTLNSNKEHTCLVSLSLLSHELQCYMAHLNLTKPAIVSSRMMSLDLCGTSESVECIYSAGNPYKGIFCCNETDSTCTHVMPQQKDVWLIVQEELIHHTTPKGFLIFFFLFNMVITYYFSKSNSVVSVCFIYRV